MNLLLPDDAEPAMYGRTATGLIVPARLVPQPEKTVKAMDFFSGAGGTTCGFIGAGIEVVGAVEMEANAILTYMTNLCRFGQVQMHFITPDARAEFERYLMKMYKRVGVRIDSGEIVQDEKFHGAPVPVAGTRWIAHEPTTTPGVSHIFVGDCRKLASKDVLSALGMERGELDIIAGSPPCQGYSTGGKRSVADPRNNLVFEFARFITEISPKAMIMEEVPGILTMVTPEGDDVIGRFCRILEDGGFGTVDALERQVRAKAGSMGFIRAKMKSAKTPKPKKIRKPKPARKRQPELL